MIAYVTVGVDDIGRAERFYSAFLPALGYKLEYYHGDLSYALPQQYDQSVASPEFYVKSPFDGAPASEGNGTRHVAKARCVNFMPPQSQQVALMRVAQDFVRPTVRVSTWATCAIPRATKSRCFQAILMNPDATMRQ